VINKLHCLSNCVSHPWSGKGFNSMMELGSDAVYDLEGVSQCSPANVPGEVADPGQLRSLYSLK